ncbi:MAG: hypothetical protein E1N59_2849 [Puniceicoccaceae bacterium 5H]|nr:MAG: hypothetical protein E1N59_2849 [Puniceicoccaceae bacterium 5H]
MVRQRSVQCPLTFLSQKEQEDLFRFSEKQSAEALVKHIQKRYRMTVTRTEVFNWASAWRAEHWPRRFNRKAEAAQLLQSALDLLTSDKPNRSIT